MKPSWERLLPLLAGAAAFTLYRFTAFPGVGGRFHPIDPQLHQHYGLVVGPFNSPWHPLYYSLTWLLQWLPLESSFPDRVTLFSSIFGAASVALACWTAQDITGRKLPAFVVALAYAVSYSQWVQSTEAEIYTLQLTMAFTIVVLLIKWSRSQKPFLLQVAIFVYFLSFGVTLSMILLLPSLLYFVCSVGARHLVKPGTLLATAASALVATLQYVPCYFHAFQAEPLAWGRNRPADLASYLYAVSGDVFHGSFSAYSFREVLLDRVPLLGWYWHREFLLPGVVVLVLGLVDLYGRQRRWFLFLSIGFLSIFAFCANYGVDDIEVFFLLSAVFSVPILAAGVAALGCHFPGRSGSTVVAACSLAWVGGSLLLTLPSFMLTDQPDKPLRRFLGDLEPGAILVNTNFSWGLTMKVRALLFAEPGLVARRAGYVEAGPDLGSRQRHLADPDVVVPGALLRRAPAYVLADHANNPSPCETLPIGVSLDDLIDGMADGDRLVLAWSGKTGEHFEPPPFRELSDQALKSLGRISLSGGSGEDSYYLGIGCRGDSCQAQESEVGYAPFSLRLDHTVSISERHGFPLAVEFSGLEREFQYASALKRQRREYATEIALTINGADVLLTARRPVSVGYPKSRPGPRYANSIVADTHAPTGSVAVLIDGRTGGVQSVYLAPSQSYELPVFEKLADVCRVVPRDFTAGGTIVLGSPEARLYLGSGFDLDTLFNGRPVVYSTGSRSHVFIPVLEARSRYQLQIEGRLAADDEQMVMDIVVNDSDVYHSPLKKGAVNTIVVDLPAGLVKDGINHILFRYSRHSSYFDLSKGLTLETGQRAVRMHTLSIIPIPERSPW